MASTTNILDLNNRIDALEKISHNVEPIQQQIDELKAWTDPGTKDASGNPITLTDGSARNAEGLAVTLEPIQSGSGTPSPTNVRPITGYTECVVDDEGKNLVSAIEQGGFGNDGTDSSASNRLRDDGYISVIGGAKYTVSNSASLQTAVFYWDEQGVATPYPSSGWKNSPYTFEVPANAKYVRIMLRKSDNSDLTPNDSYKIQMERGENATAYEPYQKHTATITFGQTVYGGTVNFKTGKATVTHASIASYNGETINEPWLSSIDEYVSGTTPTTGAQVVYPLTTPTELTLTPAELELLKGYNYISTNGTTIELTYMPDTLKADILLTVSQLYGSKISIFDGILAGGDTGQVLTKTSDDNYDATWETLPATRTTTKKSEK